MKLAALLACTTTLIAGEIRVAGVEKPVEILRDRWGVPHIYALTAHDLFFAQGYITATDRLFQIDLWRRTGTGKLAEILGPQAIARDRLARSVNFHGDWKAEWAAYGADTGAIVTAFTDGINAYIESLHGKLPAEFALAGYAPGLWAPEDCLSRVAGMGMTYNLNREVQHALDVQRLGLERAAKAFRIEPAVPLEVPAGLDLSVITSDILAAYRQTTASARVASDQGSNNWVVDGTMTATGRPMLANDPHRPVTVPSLRKSVHLVGPGWDAIGSGEPGLPGIAVGHNENVAFGFTIVGTDQQDLYVETVNPKNPAEYRYRGEWRRFDAQEQRLAVKGQAEQPITLRYTVHGPVIYEDTARHLAYTLKWVGNEPGTAGYLAGLTLARTNNWQEFRAGMERYRVPSENLVYADVKGNIGWQVGGLTPIRDGCASGTDIQVRAGEPGGSPRCWHGLLPVPGADGLYEWKGYQKSGDLPFEFNPPRHWIATANNNILPPGYGIELGYDSWSQPYRVNRIREMLGAAKKLEIDDFVRMQQDVVSGAARRFQEVIKDWKPAPGGRGAEYVAEIRKWDGRMLADSRPALVYAVWSARLPQGDISREQVQQALEAALDTIERQFGKDPGAWQWGKLHQLTLAHPTENRAWQLGPVARPGDATTVNATSGANFRQTSGASWREILDVGNWDRSVMTNVPGEVGDPSSKHYSDLLEDWTAGRYHPMPFSRKAVEAAMEERIELRP